MDLTLVYLENSHPAVFEQNYKKNLFKTWSRNQDFVTAKELSCAAKVRNARYSQLDQLV